LPVISFFLLIHSHFLNKKAKIQIDSAASAGSQGEATYFKYFPWPPLEAALSLCLVPYWHVVGSFCFLFTRCSWFTDLQQKLPRIRRH